MYPKKNLLMGIQNGVNFYGGKFDTIWQNYACIYLFTQKIRFKKMHPKDSFAKI